jgi:hypothetical protein
MVRESVKNGEGSCVVDNNSTVSAGGCELGAIVGEVEVPNFVGVLVQF